MSPEAVLWPPRALIASTSLQPGIPWRVGLPAFCTRPLRLVGVREINADFSGLEFQIRQVHLPGTLDPQNAPIQFMILHPGMVACPPHRPPSTHYKPRRANAEEPE